MLPFDYFSIENPRPLGLLGGSLSTKSVTKVDQSVFYVPFPIVTAAMRHHVRLEAERHLTPSPFHHILPSTLKFMISLKIQVTTNRTILGKIRAEAQL
jgi:hypothetical protein